MRNILNNITLLSCIVLFLFVVTSLYQVYDYYQTRGTSWEVITIVDGGEQVSVESIWTYTLGIVLSAFLWIVLITNHYENVKLRRLLETIQNE